MAVERAQLEVASPSEDDVRAADRLPSTPPPPPPSLHCLHPSPVLYCESQRQPGRVSAVRVCVQCAHAVCVCVCGCWSAPVRRRRRKRRRREVVSRSPSNISSTLHLSLAVWTACFFFFCLPACLPASLFFFSLLLPTHWFRESERARERARKKEREGEGDTQPFPAREPGYSATVELIKLMHTAAGIVLCVYVCACVCLQ